MGYQAGLIVEDNRRPSDQSIRNFQILEIRPAFFGEVGNRGA